MSDDPIPPLIEPKGCKKLKERNRIINLGIREKFWEHMEKNIVERRRPDNIADRVAEKAIRSTEQPLRNAARERARERFIDVDANDVLE